MRGVLTHLFALPFPLQYFLFSFRTHLFLFFLSQDASLESLGVAVDRLGQIGKDIHEEVAEQNVLLDSLGNEVDDAGNKMNVVTASLSKLLKTKDGCQIWTIVILTFILILLSKCSLPVHIICLIAPVPCQVFRRGTVLIRSFLSPSFLLYSRFYSKIHICTVALVIWS